nr:uncharacterized protein LOC118967526 [Manis javanica]
MEHTCAPSRPTARLPGPGPHYRDRGRVSQRPGPGPDCSASRGWCLPPTAGHSPASLPGLLSTHIHFQGASSPACVRSCGGAAAEGGSQAGPLGQSLSKAYPLLTSAGLCDATDKRANLAPSSPVATSRLGAGVPPGEGLLHCACAAFPTGTGHLLHLLAAQHPACLSSARAAHENHLELRPVEAQLPPGPESEAPGRRCARRVVPGPPWGTGTGLAGVPCPCRLLQLLSSLSP